MAALGITCAVKESSYDSYSGLSKRINRGSFGACSFFAFSVFILYFLLSVLMYAKIRNNSFNSKQGTGTTNDANKTNNINLEKI